MAVIDGSALYHITRAESFPPWKETEEASEGIRQPPRMPIPHYRFKIFQSKGAVLVLLWGFCGFFVFRFLSNFPYGHHVMLVIKSKDFPPISILCMCTLLYPLLGWLGDARYGKYSVIRAGLWILWASSILYCIASASLNYYFVEQLHATKLANTVLKIALYVPISLGLGALLSNVVQFGVSQLADASSSEITSFLRWFAWLWFVNGFLVGLTQSCFCMQYQSLALLVFPVITTASVAVDCVFNRCLVKELPASNTVSLIFRVLRYTAKNRYPQRQGALSSWEHEDHSRMDIAKERYGGPFTSEQVEDVKTFFRIAGVIVGSTLVTGFFLAVFPVFGKVMWHLSDTRYHNRDRKESDCLTYRHCFFRTCIERSGDVILTVVLPFFEFLLYPFFLRHFHISILRKMSAGVVLLIFSLAACTAIEFVANHRLDPNRTHECLLNTTKAHHIHHNYLPLDYKWMALPFGLISASNFLIFTSLGEFLCAQAPYSMKGLLFGLAYGFLGLFLMTGYGVMQLPSWVAQKWLSTGVHGCMSWYLLMALGLLLVLVLLLFTVFRCYKKRNRDRFFTN